MSQTNADRLLNRITALHKSLQLDAGGHVSSMERDLMLNYLRELYEIYASGKVVPPAPKASKESVTAAVTPPKPITPAEPPVTAQPRASFAPPASVVAPPSVSVPPMPPPPTSDSMLREPTHHQEAPVDEYDDLPIPPAPAMPRVPQVPVPPPPAPAMAAHVAHVQPNTASARAPKYSSSPQAASPSLSESLSRRSEPSTSTAPRPSAAESSEELEPLFEDGGANSRFGRMPLNDLSRALSINNRILFTRDLFGGDNELLTDTLQQLNACRDLPEAKPLICSLARRFEWPAETKLETAREFIELVRRRYV